MKKELARIAIMFLVAILLPKFCLADFNFSETQGIVLIYIMTVIPGLLYILNILVFLAMWFKSRLGTGIFYLIIIPNILLAIIIIWPRDTAMDDEAIFWFGYVPAALSICSILRRNYLFKANIFIKK